MIFMPDYKQINLKLYENEINSWQKHADQETNGNMTRFIQNCINRCISNDAVQNIDLTSVNKRLDAMSRELLKIESKIETLSKAEIAPSTIIVAETGEHQETIEERLVLSMLEKGKANALQIAHKINIPESKAMEVLEYLVSVQVVRRNYATRPNTFEIMEKSVIDDFIGKKTKK